MIQLEGAAPAGLPPTTWAALVHGAAVALQRRHRSGVILSSRVRGAAFEDALCWNERPAATERFEEPNRMTETGAEAIALALASTKCDWRIIRRLTSRKRERADWLLADPKTGATMILEVGGTDAGDVEALLDAKLKQAARSPFRARGTPCAYAIRFVEPMALLEVSR